MRVPTDYDQRRLNGELNTIGIKAVTLQDCYYAGKAKAKEKVRIV